jgi:hypothetical protein
MKIEWQIYQTLELIPDEVQHPNVSFWERLLAPLRRPLANTFVRELSQRHQILLFKRCLDLANSESLQGDSAGAGKSVERSKVNNPQQTFPEKNSLDKTGDPLPMQQWLEPGGVPWWAWEDM